MARPSGGTNCDSINAQAKLTGQWIEMACRINKIKIKKHIHNLIVKVIDNVDASASETLKGHSKYYVHNHPIREISFSGSADMRVVEEHERTCKPR